MLNKCLGDLNVMEYLVGKLVLECEVAKLARNYTTNMVAGPLLGGGCKVARPWGRRSHDK